MLNWTETMHWVKNQSLRKFLMLLSVFEFCYIVAVIWCSRFDIRWGDILGYELRTGKMKIKRKIVKSRKFENGYHSECYFRVSIFECQFRMSNTKTHLSSRCQFQVSTCECQFANVKYQDALVWRMSISGRQIWSTISIVDVNFQCQFENVNFQCQFVNVNSQRQIANMKCGDTLVWRMSISNVNLRISVSNVNLLMPNMETQIWACLLYEFNIWRNLKSRNLF